MDNKTLSNSDTGIILDDNKFYIVDVNYAFDIILKLIKSNYYFFIINAPKNNGNNQNNKLFMNKSFLKDLVRYGLSSVLMKGYNKSNEEEYIFFVTSHYRRNGILYRDIKKIQWTKCSLRIYRKY